MYDALVTVGSFAFPEPSAYEANTAAIVDSARNLNGYVTGAVIRNDVAKITLSWNYLTAAQWAEILACFNPSQGGSFYNSVRFYNQCTNAWETRTMYVGDRSSGIWRRNPDTKEPMGWVNPKLALVEV